MQWSMTECIAFSHVQCMTCVCMCVSCYVVACTHVYTVEHRSACDSSGEGAWTGGRHVHQVL